MTITDKPENVEITDNFSINDNEKKLAFISITTDITVVISYRDKSIELSSH